MPVDPADFISADAPGTKPKPTLPPARADSLRKFLLLVDIRFVSPVRITRVDYDIGSKYAQERLLGKKELEGFWNWRQCDKESQCDKQIHYPTKERYESV